MSFYGYAPYVSVAERRAKALKQLEKMKKKGLKVQPVQLAGRKIADSFWGKGWCDHMESFSDYANRLPRGRSYVRNGSVCHLEIQGGGITAIVSGSVLYNVSITISPLTKKKWDALKYSCTGRIGSLIDLLRGRLDRGVMEVVADRKEGLFPLPGEMKFDCDCPDWASMCKHVAAVLYGVGARLDHSPEMLFLLRGVNHAELVDVSAAITGAASAGTSRRRIAASGLADVFGVDMVDAAELPSAVPVVVAPPIKTKAFSKNQTSGKTVNITGRAPKKMPRKTSATTSKNRIEQPVIAPLPDSFTGNAIHTWRLSLGETQAAFAKRLGFSVASISLWEKKGKDAIGIQARTLSVLRKAWEMTH